MSGYWVEVFSNFLLLVVTEVVYSAYCFLL